MPFSKTHVNKFLFVFGLLPFVNYSLLVLDLISRLILGFCFSGATLQSNEFLLRPGTVGLFSLTLLYIIKNKH